MPTPARRLPPKPPRPPVATEGVAARAAALQLMQASLDRRGGLDDGLRGEAFAALDGRDRAFARALAAATLRRLGLIDRLLAARMQKPAPPAVQALLRLGAGQLLALEAPAFAAVSTTLALAEREAGTRPFKGLINAVLRGLDRDGGPALLATLPPEAALPDWLAARWRATWGEAGVRALAERLAEEPATDVTPRDPAESGELATLLEAVPLPGGSLRTALKGDPSAWPGYAEGRWWVQDAAAALPARLLGAGLGQTALDLCAAPGGKTLQLAAAGAEVTALDRSETRLRRVAENLARTGLAAEVIAADAGDWDDGRRFDAVLLDAPCSATGTFRRHPDVLWAARPGDVAKLAAVQARLLEAAARLTAPGGRLVYCVCSLEPEEGEAQVEPFLARHPEFARDPATADDVVWPGVSGADATWRILPGAPDPTAGADGFFIARFRRAG